MLADEKRRLGRTHLELSSLGLGTVGIGNLFRSISDEEANATVQTAWDAGIRLFDTAPLYGHGLAELRLGRSLRQKPRGEYVLCTKVGRRLQPKRRAEIDFGDFVDAAPFELQFDYSYDGAMRAFEDSLQRLALERVDICLIHDIDVLTWRTEQPEIFRQAMAGAWKALERLRADGSVTAIGLGVNEWEVCQTALRDYDVDCFLLAGRFTLLEQHAAGPFLSECQERKIGVLIGGGFNSGILATCAVEGARYNYAPAPAEILERVRRLEAVCHHHGVPFQAAAIQFVAAHPAVTSFVTGGRTPLQVQQNVSWLEFSIPVALWAELKLLAPPTGSLAPRAEPSDRNENPSHSTHTPR